MKPPSRSTRAVDRLEGKGLIQRRRNSGDARVVLVSLTATGSATQVEAHRRRVGLALRLIGHVSPDDGNAIGRLWPRLAAAVEEVIAGGIVDLELEPGDLDTLDQIAACGGRGQMSELAAGLQVAPDGDQGRGPARRSGVGRPSTRSRRRTRLPDLADRCRRRRPAHDRRRPHRRRPTGARAVHTLGAGRAGEVAPVDGGGGCRGVRRHPDRSSGWAVETVTSRRPTAPAPVTAVDRRTHPPCSRR